VIEGSVTTTLASNMTGGSVCVARPTGHNFGAGMTGRLLPCLDQDKPAFFDNSTMSGSCTISTSRWKPIQAT